ncbi:MAG: shikimate dehydrogenase [Chitinophagaceae bacterium]
MYGLIGFPLSHSFSEKYFSDFFIRENIPAVFKNFPIENADRFPEIIQTYPALKGLAVTIPFKKSIIPFLEKISQEAEETGACNCIKIRDGKCTGFNTDIIGFEKSFIPAILPTDKKALILGTGGASAAAVFVCKKNKIDFLFVSRKKNEKKNTINYEEIDENIMQQYSILINATPVGQVPEINAAPNIPYRFLTQKHYLFDMIYNPAETQFLKNGLSHGARIKNGLQMLEIQAMENWKIWNG